MEPTFFRTSGSAQQAARIRARHRNQAIGAVLLVAVVAVAVYFLIYKPGPKQTGTPDAQQGNANAPRLAGEAGQTGGVGQLGQPGQPGQPARLPVRLPAGNPTTRQDVTRTPSLPPVDNIQRGELSALLADADLKLNAKDLLNSRRLYNKVVDKGLPPAENGRVVKKLELLADQMLFSPTHVENDPLTTIIQVAPPGYLLPIANKYKLRYALIEQINKVNARNIQIGQNLKVIYGPFHAVVDKSDFTMTIYIGLPGGPNDPTSPLLVRRFRVGLGEHNSTPTGVWKIKDMSQFPAYTHPRTRKVIPKDDPEYPFGQLGYWIALQGVDGNAVGESSYGIHSTNDPASIGKMASLGCVRMLDDDVKQVWNLLRTEHSRVEIRD